MLLTDLYAVKFKKISLKIKKWQAFRYIFTHHST